MSRTTRKKRSGCTSVLKRAEAITVYANSQKTEEWHEETDTHSLSSHRYYSKSCSVSGPVIALFLYSVQAETE